MLAGGASTIGRPTLARWTAPVVTLKDDEQLIKDAIDGDETAMIEISDYGKVSPGDRVMFITKLLAGGVSGREISAIARIWGTWSGEAFVRIASEHIDLWKKSAEHSSTLNERPEIEKIKLGFLGGVESTVAGYLSQNKKIVEDEAQEVRRPEGPGADRGAGGAGPRDAGDPRAGRRRADGAAGAARRQRRLRRGLRPARAQAGPDGRRRAEDPPGRALRPRQPAEVRPRASPTRRGWFPTRR